MIRRAIIVLAAVLTLSTESAFSQTVTLPLPGLVGPMSRTRTQAFDLGMSFQTIGEVRFRCSGTMTPGLARDFYTGALFPLDGQIEVFMDPGPGLWLVYVGPYNGSFGDQQSFTGHFGATWDFLLDGQAEITAHLVAAVGNYTVIMLPAATITDARLIIEGPIKLSNPDGGEALPGGSTYTIGWVDFRSDGNCPGNYLLDYSSDNGQNWTPVDSNSASSTCSYDWLVPSINSDQSLIRIIDADDPNVSDTTDAAFTIYECTLKTDLTGDCVVNFLDFATLMDEWLKCGNPFDPNCSQ